MNDLKFSEQLLSERRPNETQYTRDCTAYHKVLSAIRVRAINVQDALKRKAEIR